jgi:hypothetical protein
MTLQTVTRNLTEKRKTDSIICVGTTSFHACMGGQDRILALTGIVLDNNSPKKMWFCFTHAPLPLEAKSKYTSVWVVANMLPKAWVWTDVPFPSGALGFLLSNPADLISDFIKTKGPQESQFSKHLQNSTAVVPKDTGEMDSSSNNDEDELKVPVQGKRGHRDSSNSQTPKSLKKQKQRQQKEKDTLRAEMQAG